MDMTTSAIATTTHTLGAAVADEGTFTVAYPTGFNQAALTGTSGGEVVVGENDAWAEDDPGFAFSFGASNITVTNNTGATIAAGTDLTISFGENTNSGVYNPIMKVADPGAITDSTGGTASTSDTLVAVGGSYSQSVVANNFATLAAKYEELRSVLESAGLIR